MFSAQKIWKSNSSAQVPWALVISTFINKSGEMAMSLLPMLLIERSLSSGDSSLIMGATKVAQMGGLFVGGFMTDILGYRFIILLSYFLSFVGFVALPFLRQEIFLGLGAVLAQFGASLFSPASRALIRLTSAGSAQKSLAWLRTSSNLGQVVSSIFGIVLGPLGLLIPFLVDAVTSLAAFLIGLFTIQNPAPTETSDEEGGVQKGYFRFAVALAFFTFVYDLGFLSFSGFGKLALGNDGIRAYGVVLLVNTFLCGILAVPSAQVFLRPLRSLSLGAVVVTSGMIMMTLLPKQIFYFGLCSLVMTLGELIFNVHAQALLLLNSQGKSSKHYGFALMIQSLGRFAAGIVLFPLVLKSGTPWLPFLVGPLGFFAMILWIPKPFFQRAENPKT